MCVTRIKVFRWLAVAVIISFGALAGAVSAPDAAKAMKVRPLVLDMKSVGREARSTLQVINDGANPLPVEIVIYRLELDENGEQTTTEAGDNWLIFPPQAMVGAGSSQTFRIQWVGDPEIPESQSFIFSVNQVPVQMPEGQSGVQVVFNFAAIVNIAPPRGAPALELVGAEVGTDDDGNRRPALTLRNPTNVHALASEATISVSGDGWSTTMTPRELDQKMGLGLVQPGKTRRLLIPVDVPDGVSRISASIDYKP